MNLLKALKNIWIGVLGLIVLCCSFGIYADTCPDQVRALPDGWSYNGKEPGTGGVYHFRGALIGKAQFPFNLFAPSLQAGQIACVYVNEKPSILQPYYIVMISATQNWAAKLSSSKALTDWRMSGDQTYVTRNNYCNFDESGFPAPVNCPFNPLLK